MKVVGLITEYNPFHNGHSYHIEKAKELTGADFVLVVMSGNYVQRGAPAFMPKHLRAKCALECGADAVLELPVCYAAGSAEYFAAGAVSLLDNLNCIDSICFGSECGDLTLLSRVARLLSNEPEEYKQAIQCALKTGLSFPLARYTALLSCGGDASLTSALTQPNNILGIEYLKALYQRNSSIKAYTIRRAGTGYHDTALACGYSSASAIRNIFDAHEEFPVILQQIEPEVPASSLPLLAETYKKRYPVCTNDFSLLLKHKLLTESSLSLTQYLDVTEELANRIENLKNDFLSFEQFCNLVKTKDITYTRVSRSLLHILLGIQSSNLHKYQEKGDVNMPVSSDFAGKAPIFSPS